MLTEHTRAQLYADSAAGADIARLIEQAIEDDRRGLGEDLADRLSDIEFDRVYSPGRRDDMEWILDEASRALGAGSKICQMLQKMHKEMSEVQADVDTAAQELIEHMGNI